MSELELTEKLNAIEAEYLKKKKAIQIEYAISNNPYKIGDVISDHYKTIIIKSWKFWISSSVPCLVYYGTRLTKAGTPAKNQEENAIYQMNIK